MRLHELEQKGSNVTPVTGVVIGNTEDKSTWHFTYEGDPTSQEKLALQVIIDNYRIKNKVEEAEDEEANVLLITTNEKVALHVEQKIAGIVTTLTDEEYLLLITEREAARTLLRSE